ncbi:cell surface A33 antigen-like isoform X2 [Trichomycterus rosablanca]|uniref:cell surface A33 antigen-like isoform X2 n=1 Tax=Trichomycterus rosablanca TaxID=2290929 RepID=UPI002F35FAA5
MQMFVLLFLSALHLTEGCSELKHQEKVTGNVRQSVVLPCSCTKPQHTTEKPTWIFGNDKLNGKEIYPDNKTKRYTGRVQLLHPHDPGNFSLLISNLTEKDGGVYRCKISNISRNIQLAVTGCSKPKHQVMGFVGQSIVLPCSCTEPQQRAKNITWLFRNHNCHRTQIYPEDRTKRYTVRVQLLHPGDSGNFSLRISNLTEEDGGEYRCKIGNISRNIQLNVTDTEMPTSLIIGAAVGGLLLLMGLGVVIYWRYRGRRDGRTGSREEQPGQRGQQEAQNKSD